MSEMPRRPELAMIYEAQLKQQKHSGTQLLSTARQTTLNDYFSTWFETVRSQATPGWRRVQQQLFRDYIAPHLGEKKLQSVNPPMVAHVLNEMGKLGRSPQLQAHVFNLLRKLFGDAIELFQFLTYNPALKSLKPRIPLKEGTHLNLEQSRRLLVHVAEKEFGVAIWLQVFLGLRVGEVQALTWSDVDLDSGIVHIRRAYSRKDSWATQTVVIREYPKGRKQHSKPMPGELVDYLRDKRSAAHSLYVAAPARGEMLSYETYCRTLKRYCKALAIPVIGTHGLRHSTSAVYLSHGATRDDLRSLFAHSSPAVTERYTHGEGSGLQQVASVIRLFPGKCSTNVPPTRKNIR